MPKLQTIHQDSQIVQEAARQWLCDHPLEVSALPRQIEAWDHVVELCCIALCLPTPKLTTLLRERAVHEVAATAIGYRESPLWFDVGRCNQRRVLELFTIERLTQRIADSRMTIDHPPDYQSDKALLVSILQGPYLSRAEWPPHVLLELAIAVEELGLDAPFVCSGEVLAHLFSEGLSLWQWYAQSFVKLSHVIQALGSSDVSPASRLTPIQQRYLQRCCSVLLTEAVMTNAVGDMTEHLLACHVLRLLDSSILLAGWRALRMATQSKRLFDSTKSVIAQRTYAFSLLVAAQLAFQERD